MSDTDSAAPPTTDDLFAAAVNASSETVEAPPETEAPPEPEPTPDPTAGIPEKFKDADGNVDIAKLAKSYGELSAQFTQERQAAAAAAAAQQEPDDEPEYTDPWSILPPHLDDATQERIVRLLDEDAVAVVRHAHANPDWLGEHWNRQIETAAWQRDPGGMARYEFEQRIGEHQAQLRAEVEQEFAPVRTQMQQQMAQASEAMVRAAIPNYDAVEPHLAAIINEMPHLFAGRNGSPEAITQAMWDAWGIYNARQVAAGNASHLAPQQAPETTAPQAASTTRSSATPPKAASSPDGITDEMIHESILAGVSPFSRKAE